MTEEPAARPVEQNASPPDSAAPPEPRGAEPTTPATRDEGRRTRTSALWVGVVIFAVVLVLLLIFILQNTQSVEISYFGASGSLPLAVAMLLATVAGVLLTAIAASLRIWQLRRRLTRSARH